MPGIHTSAHTNTNPNLRHGTVRNKERDLD
jgi:hypothetical protein